MAFDLVQYFAEQIKIQKPELLSQYSDEERLQYLSEANTLSLGKLITLMRQDGTKLYQEIQTQDHLYIQELARHLTTSPQNESQLAKADLEHSLTTMLGLQFAELKQLDVTGTLVNMEFVSCLSVKLSTSQVWLMTGFGQQVS